MARQIRIMIVDDHTLVRTSLTTVLGTYPDLTVVGQAADGEEGVELAAKLKPDVVLMDMGMPRKNGVQATRALVERCPEIRVIGLSMYEADIMAAPMLQAGAVAYVEKFAPIEKLVGTIRRVCGLA